LILQTGKQTPYRVNSVRHYVSQQNCPGGLGSSPTCKNLLKSLLVPINNALNSSRVSVTQLISLLIHITESTCKCSTHTEYSLKNFKTVHEHGRIKCLMRGTHATTEESSGYDRSKVVSEQAMKA